jgi:hypothetical protein
MTFLLPVMIGPPTWGIGPGLTLGQAWRSEILAASGMEILASSDE